MQADLSQKARVIMHRLTTAIRASREDAPVTAAQIVAFELGQAVTENSIELYDFANRLMRYRLDVPAGQLMFRVDTDLEAVPLGGV